MNGKGSDRRPGDCGMIVDMMREAPLAYSVKELERMIPIGRAACYRLANQLGVRVGKRIVVPRANLERWLSGQK